MSVFIDTGPWYAGVVPDDPRHAEVMAWHRQNNRAVVTTDYVIDIGVSPTARAKW
jgi:predicted nucleic acid-binding protein